MCVCARAHACVREGGREEERECVCKRERERERGGQREREEREEGVGGKGGEEKRYLFMALTKVCT